MMGRNDETIFLQLLFNSLINMYLILYLLMAFLPPPSLPLSIPPTVSNPPSQFPLLIPLITSSLTDNTFISCRIKFTKTSLIDCRRITLKSGDHLQLNYKQSTSDTALNVPLSKDCSQVTAKLLSLPSPTAAALKTLTSDYTLKNNTLHAAPPTTTTLPSSAHDRAKTQPIPPTATFLQLLNVTTSTGKPYVKMSNKLRQINQFVAVLEPRLPKVDGEREGAEREKKSARIPLHVFHRTYSIARIPSHVFVVFLLSPFLTLPLFSQRPPPSPPLFKSTTSAAARAT